MNTVSYSRLTKSINDKGLMIPVSDLSPDKIQAYTNKEPDSAWYYSLFEYSQEGQDYYKNNGNSIAGYHGNVQSDKLFFDFDDKENPENAKKDAEKLLQMFDSQGINVSQSVKVYFSGCKGFHVVLHTNRVFNPTQMKEVATITKEVLELETIDTVIYNTTRLIRLPNTKHEKTGLYKIEIEPDDLINKSIEEIRAKAANPVLDTFSIEPTSNLKFLDSYKVLYGQLQNKPKFKANTAVTAKVSSGGLSGIQDVDFTKCPKSTPRCVYTLSHGVMPTGVGLRNQYFLRLAAFYKNQGFTQELVQKTLEGIAEANFKNNPEKDMFSADEIKNTCVKSVFSTTHFKQIPGASGFSEDNDIMKDYCSSLDPHTSKKCCLHHKSENLQKSAMKIEDVSNIFEKFAVNFDKNTVKTGISFVDEHLNIAVSTVNLLVGSSGSGKTTLSLNILENSNKLDQHAMFFSMDMSKNLVYLKLAQKATNYTQKQIFEFFKTGNKIKQGEINEAIKHAYGKTFFDFSSTLTMEQMRDRIQQVEQDNGEKIKLVITDYAGRITGPYSDTFANANYNALKSTEVAEVTESAWIYLNQISRSSGDGCSPLRTKRAAKDSSTWEEVASGMITIWRPFLSDPNRDDVVRLFLAKNRMGRELEEVLWFDGAKGSITDMTDQERADYAASREAEEKEYLKSKLNKT